MLNKYDNYSLIYSPRTKLSMLKEEEDQLFKDLQLCFEPNTMLIIKTHFKERLGVLDKITFITIFKKHLTLWHPNLPNRNEILIKLLSRLFDEIDINSNGDLEWSEFMNYLTSNANNDISYNIGNSKRYIVSSTPLIHKEKNDLYEKINSINQYDIVSYSFYIEKYKLIGIAHENKSKIFFFDSETHSKENAEIDLMQIQKQIDEYELNELNQRTQLILKIEAEMKKIMKKNENNRLNIKSDIISYNNRNALSPDNKKIIRKTTKKLSLLLKETKRKNLIKNSRGNKHKHFEDEDEDEDEFFYKLNKDFERELKLLNESKKHLKLCAIRSCFSEKYNLLFISSTNNKISGWRFNPITREFKNVNIFSYEKHNFSFNLDNITLPLLVSDMPQFTLCFDELKNILYSGQEDGKILAWNMESSKPSYTLDINEFINKKNANSIIDLGQDLDILGFLKQIKEFQDKYESKIASSRFTALSFSLDKTINELALKELKIKKIKEKKMIENKRKIVSCLIMLNNLRLLCSAYYTGKIVLWDTDAKKPKKMFLDQTTGIYNIEFDERKNLIYTSGFDHEIHVYAPYNQNDCVYKLKGHNSSIKSMSLNHEENELITIDIMGNMKVWDLNTSINFQTININDSVLIEQNHLKKLMEQNTFNVNKNKTSNLHLICLPNVNKILIYGEKFLIFEKAKTKNSNLSDDNLILGSLYNTLTNDIITFSNKRVKFWNIFNGTCKQIFEDPLKGTEITAFTCDKMEKRFYLGDINGKIKNFNLTDGSFLKDFHSHKNEITNIIYSSKYEFLISCSVDLTILIQADDQILKTDVIKEINLSYLLLNISVKDNKNLIRGLKYNEENNTIIIALYDGMISYYDIDHLKFIDNNNDEEELQNNERRKYPITNIEDLSDINLIFIGCENGDKYLVMTVFNKYYHLFKDEKIGKFQNVHYLKNNNNNNGNKNLTKIDITKNTVMYSKYDMNNHRFFIGDFYGYISCYDMNGLISTMNKDYESNEDVVNTFVKKDLNINMIYLIQGKKESIKHINISEEIIPKILIITYSNRNVHIFDYNNGDYIDSLRQIIDKNYPVPIGIKYFKNNPFMEDINICNDNKIFYNEEDIKKDIIQQSIEEEIDKNTKEDDMINTKKRFSQKINIIYRDSNSKTLSPYTNYNSFINKNPFILTNDICEYNAHLKLKKFTQNINILPYKSTNWNYNIDVDHYVNEKNEEFNHLLNNVNKKEKEIIQAEKKFLTNSIFSKDYKPIFLRNLDDEEKKTFNEILEEKIRTIRFSIRKKNILNCKNESIKDIEKRVDISNNKNKIYNTINTIIPNNKKLIIKNLKLKENKNLRYKKSKLEKLVLNALEKNTEKESKTTKSSLNKTKKTFSCSDLFSEGLESRKDIFIGKKDLLYSNKDINKSKDKKYKFSDSRFEKYLNIFDQKYNELYEPFSYLLNKENKNTKKLPLIKKP